MFWFAVGKRLVWVRFFMIEMFDRQFQLQFYAAENVKQVNISENDGMPTDRAISMRKIFGPLFLEKPPGWHETYIM